MGTTMVSFLIALAVQQTVDVTAGTLNVRQGPGTGYAVVGQAAAGQRYVQVGASGSWRKIWFDGEARWVHGDYVAPSTAAPKQVTAPTLNVRAGPGTSYAVVGTVPAGSWWAVIGASGAWKKVWFAGTARWMHGSYLGAAPPPPPVSTAGFVQLPASGTGFTSYSPADRRWGTPAMVYGLIAGAQDWATDHPDRPRMGVGDLSLINGGPISGHVSHQVGKDVDVRPVRTDAEGPTTIFNSNYSSSRTKDLIVNHLKPELDVKVIFFNDPEIEGPLSYVQPWPNHDNHFHLRIN